MAIIYINIIMNFDHDTIVFNTEEQKNYNRDYFFDIIPHPAALGLNI